MQVFEQLGRAFRAGKKIAHHQHGPPVAHQLERTSYRTSINFSASQSLLSFPGLLPAAVAFLDRVLSDLVKRRAGSFAPALWIRQDPAADENVANGAFVRSLVEVLIGSNQGICSLFESRIARQQKVMRDHELFRGGATERGAQFPQARRPNLAVVVNSPWRSFGYCLLLSSRRKKGGSAPL